MCERRAALHPTKPIESFCMQHLLFALSLGFGILVFQSQAHSNPINCAERNNVIASLGEKYGETRRSVGLDQNNRVVELYASETTGTWTLLLTLPDGRTCLMAAGDAFQATNPMAQPTGEPT